MSEHEAIQAAVRHGDLALPEVDVELAGLMDDVDGLCGRAQSIADYLSSVDEERLRRELARAQAGAAGADPEVAGSLAEAAAAIEQQLETIAALRLELGRFDARMTQLTSGLGAIRGQVVRLAVESRPDASGRVLEQIASVRSLVTGITRSLEAAAARAPGDTAAD
jgi:hypothetical protein